MAEQHPVLFELQPFSFRPQGRTVLDIRHKLTVPAGCCTAIIGPNGAGKSTLLKALIGHFGTDSRISGRPAATVLSAGKIAWVGQNSRYTLPLNVREYVLLGHKRGSLLRPQAPDTARLHELLDYFELAHLAEKRIDTLSGGEQQRANIVRALMQEAELILLDEPCNHLDLRHQHRLMHFLRENRRLSPVMVLHDLNLAAAYAAHIILMNQGSVSAQGNVTEVMDETLLSEVYRWPVKRLQTPSGRFHFDLYG